MNIERLMNIKPTQPLGVEYDDAWYLAAIMDGRDQLLEPQVTHWQCRELGSIDLSINELKAALLSAPGYLTRNMTDWSPSEDAAVASYFARVLIAGKSGAYGLPQERANVDA